MLKAAEQLYRMRSPPLRAPPMREDDDDDYHEPFEEVLDQDSWVDLKEVEEQDDDDEETILSLLLDSWKQHLIAIVIALVATLLAYRMNYVVAPSTPEQQQQQHAHIEAFQRTANITFCDPILNNKSLQQQQQQQQALAFMDFSLPKKYLKAMKAHYIADGLQDDSYEAALLEDNNNNDFLSKHSQFQCMMDAATNTKSFIKGFTYYYKTPSFESMYPTNVNTNAIIKQQHKLQPAYLTSTAFAVKFVNLSPKPVLLFWDGKGQQQQKLVGEIAPFESLGTAATTPGQSFSITPVYDSSHALDRWVVTADDCILYYEPSTDTFSWSLREQTLYAMQKLNAEFAKDYLVASGRPWFGNFPRAFPIHYMWSADSFGQSHKTHGYQLQVASVTPRVFTIDNFLSKEECEHLVAMATTDGFTKSSLYAGSIAKQSRDLSTRSSSNVWLGRQTAELTDRIYRRAAKILNIDESLLQKPIDDDVHPHHHSLAESLQVVRYKKGEKYAPHHDFVYPPQTHRYQPTRFATLLLYLNDDFEGGETVFPRAVNAQYHEGVKIEPRQGRAVLFYNMLPDGNVDDLSLHGGSEVTQGEKYLATLWIWDALIN